MESPNAICYWLALFSIMPAIPFQAIAFQSLGMERLKKLQGFMVDARIPRAWRDSIPLVSSTRGMLWVMGYRLAHWVRITEETEQVLCLECLFEPGRPFDLVAKFRKGAWGNPSGEGFPQENSRDFCN